MHRVLLAAILIATPAWAESKLDALLSQNLAARGGARAEKAVRALDMRLDLVEPKFALQADYLVNRRRCMRIDVYSGDKYLQSEGVSSKGGWQGSAGENPVRPQPEGGTATLLHGIDSPVRLIGLNEFAARGHRLTYAGQETLGATSYDRIDATYADGYTAAIYLDRSTHLIARIRESKPMHLAVDPTKLFIETQFSDYRPAGGVMFPFFSREVNWKTGEELGHTTVRAITINTPAALAVCEPMRTPRTV